MTPSQRGYLDTQLTSILVGAGLLAGVAHLATHPEASPGGRMRVLVIGGILSLLALVFGYVQHMSSVRTPESPFNRHVSPFLVGALVAGSLGYGAWRAHQATLDALAWVLGGLIVVPAALAVFLEYTRR